MLVHSYRKPRYLSAAERTPKGRVHDKKLYDRSRLRVPRGVGKTGDSAYQGTDVRVPKKKPKKGELTPEEKRSNRELSRRRIVAEHGIGKMKIWRIAAERYRNPVNRHTVMMKNIAGLHNRMYG